MSSNPYEGFYNGGQGYQEFIGLNAFERTENKPND